MLGASSRASMASTPGGGAREGAGARKASIAAE
jgi:hypothetical protein